MSQERDECCGAFRDGSFLVLSGYSTDFQGTFLKSAEAFDPATGKWMSLMEEKSAAIGVDPAAVVAATDGRLFRCVQGCVEVTDKSGLTWRKFVELPESDDGMKTVAPRLVICPGDRNKLVLIGSRRRGITTSAAIYYMELDQETEKEIRWIPAALPPPNLTSHVQSVTCLEI